MSFKVEVVPHNPQWRDAFDAESQQVAEAMGENVVAIHHIGSTAIPNILIHYVIALFQIRGVEC